jgi:hypothetical protein
MSKHWIVVADQSKARIFTVDDPRGELQELEQLEHPVGRDQAQTLGSDRPGRSFDSSGQGRHAMGTSVEAKGARSYSFRQAGRRPSAGSLSCRPLQSAFTGCRPSFYRPVERTARLIDGCNGYRNRKEPGTV